MEEKRLHGWQLSIPQALDWQYRLAGQVSRNNEVTEPRFIAGVDIAVGRAAELATGAIVVLSYPELRVVEVKVARGRLDFPYVPGLLSFRESPLTLAVANELSITPDLILVDGQGLAHPRRFGLACHLGLLWDKPTIGCAKSRLYGSHQEPGIELGSYAEVMDGDETIGVALRAKRGVKPVYVSIGHKVDLETAIHWVLACCRGHRLPEPTRLAHLAAGGNLKLEQGVAAPEVAYQR
ncbi:MAG: deoxyribonuclease V [Chloroflexi bacterium]|nr:deoxyribonuclease V [Chloroflexota bacterium]